MANMQKTLLAALATAWLVQPLFAAVPVVAWNGANKDFASSSREQRKGDNTYTLNVNGNRVDDNNSYIQIEDFNDQAGVTITVANDNPAVTNGFGTGGALTVIMKCRNMPVGEPNNRAIITLMDGRRYKYGKPDEPDNGAVVGMYVNNGTSGWIWKGSIANMTTGLSGGLYDTVSGAFSSGEQMVALTYSNAGGTAYYVNGALIQSHSSLKARELAAPCGVSLGGVDNRLGTQFHALSGMRIEAIAVFNATLNASEVAAFEFEPNILLVSAINDTYGSGSASGIDVEVDDGAIIRGNTQFEAPKVNFICDGSITVEPPTGNTTVFDFSGVKGDVVISYTGTPPSRSGDCFTSSTVPTWVTDSTKWTNTIAFVDMTIAGPNFNDYGNAQSSLKLSGVQGYVNTGTEYVVPVVLENGSYSFALKLTDGYSPDNKDMNEDRCSMFSKISGRGSIVDGIAANGKSAWPVVKIYDASDFHGDIALDRATLLICGSTTTYSPSLYELFNATIGTLRIETGKTATLVGGKAWSVKRFVSSGSLTVDGTLSASVANVVGDALSGSGNIVASGFLPEGSFTNTTWTGTLSISDLTAAKPLNIHLLGHSGSTVALSAIGASGAYLPANVEAGKVVLTGDGNGVALALNNGFSNANTTFFELAGTGTFSQSNTNIVQGLTINAMTDFTGTLALTNMTVTFGTAKRIGQKQESGGWVKDETTASKLFVDSDAVLSVPAGFRLWAPPAVVLDGPIDFQTDEATNYKDLVLLDNLGSGVQQPFGTNFVVSINGTPLKDLPGGTSYKVKLVDDTLVLKRFGSAFRFR